MWEQKLKKTSKILILGLSALILGNNFLFNLNFIGADKVYASAQSTPQNGGGSGDGNAKTETKDGMQAFAETMEGLNHVMYVLMWPMLALAGISMDNDFVYGKAFKLDVALWNFWTMTRTFANYILGFFFIVSILLYFFKFKEDKHDPRKLIPQLLVAAILIQSSWFLMGAVVDVATIATYAFGALPLKAIQGSKIGKSPLLFPDVVIDLGGNSQISSGSFNAVTFKGGKASSPTTFSVCKSNGDDKPLEKLVSGSEGNYCVYSHPKFNWIVVEIGRTKKDIDTDPKAKETSDEILTKAGGSDMLSLENVIKFGKGMTGPFYALYASLMNMVSITAANKSAGTLTLEFLLKGIVTFALLAPLFALAVVMVIRIVVMWLYIGFSPIIALMAGLKGQMDPKGGGMKMDKFELSTVLGMIFMPVIAVFALSISIVFLSALLEGPAASGESQQGIWSGMGITINNDKNKTCMEINALGIKQCVTNKDNDFSISVFFNMFSRILVNLFGIALMWTVVFAALKSSKITKGVVDKIEGFAGGLLKAAPIVPVPGVGMVGVGALGQAASNLNQIPSGWQNKNYQDTLKPFVDSLGADSKSGSGGSGGSGVNPEFGKAVAAAGAGGASKPENQGKILDAWNKGKGDNEKAKDFESMVKDPKFIEELSKNKDYLNAFNESKELIDKIKASAVNKDPLNGKNGDKYYYGDNAIYQIQGDKKIINVINPSNVAETELKKFITDLTTEADYTKSKMPTSFKVGDKNYKIKFGNTNELEEIK